ncbi:MAG: glycosyltransferase [Bacteroidota bacterium]
MPTILFLSHSASHSGAPLLLKDIVSLLDKSKYHPVFIVDEDGPLVSEFREMGQVYIDPVYPDEMKYWREIKRVNKRIQLLRRIHPDAVYCNTIKPAKWLFYTKLLRIPSIVHVHELSLGFASLTPEERWLLKTFPDRMIAVSEAVKNFLIQEKGFDANKIDVVHAGIIPEKFSYNASRRTEIRQSLGIDDSIVIGTVGRISNMKGFDIFIDIANRLKTETKGKPHFKFLVIGIKEDEEFYCKFIRNIERLGLQNDIILKENVEDVALYYSAMDIYLSTAREDPFPLVIMEAMASGLPVIGFSVGGIPEAVTSDCGILVPLMDIQSVVDSLRNLANNEMRRTQMGEAGRKRVFEKFSLPRNVKQIEAVIDRVLNAK